MLVETADLPRAFVVLCSCYFRVKTVSMPSYFQNPENALKRANGENEFRLRAVL